MLHSLSLIHPRKQDLFSAFPTNIMRFLSKMFLEFAEINVFIFLFGVSTFHENLIGDTEEEKEDN
jgi:hypothetical protein